MASCKIMYGSNICGRWDYFVDMCLAICCVLWEHAANVVVLCAIIPTVLFFLQTYTGRILIAVNPFAKLPHMYDMHMMEQYRGVQFGELSPHVFAIADASYRYGTWKPACSVLARN